MLATSARIVPCIAPASAFAALKVSVSPDCSMLTVGPNRRDSEPSGPLTEISPPAIVTSTLAGSLIGLLPIRDISLGSPSGNDAKHFAADPGGARLAIGHHAVRRRYDGDPQPVHHARDIVLALVDAQTRLGHALDLLDHRPAGVVLERNLELRLGFVADDGKALDVAFVLQHLGDRQLYFRHRHLHGGFFRQLRIAD